MINGSIYIVLDFNNRTLNENDRLAYFISLNKNDFSRKDYMNIFKDISSSTTSRDLKRGVELNFFVKIGEKNKTLYKISGHNTSIEGIAA